MCRSYSYFVECGNSKGRSVIDVCIFDSFIVYIHFIPLLYRNEQGVQLGCVFLGPVNWLTFIARWRYRYFL